MSKLVWDDVGARSFETGVDRGVLYHPNGSGVPWSGIINVTENAAVTTTPVIYEGRKINDIVTSRSFTGSLRAFTYPDEFMEYEGIVEDAVGFLITEQPMKRFHLSYRTKVGDDIEGIDAGYKIHILYDVIAVPSSRSYRTLSLDVAPLEFEWTISAIPREISGFKPTSHVILDTRRLPVWFLSDIEEILYGTDSTDAFLPSLESLASYLRGWDRIIITDNGDGTWTASTTRTDAIVDLGDGEFQINDANAVYLDPITYEVSSTAKSEDELWQQ